MTDTIIKIQPSDLISDSMVKINRNFEIISNRDDVTESKLNEWAKNIEDKLADIRNENGIISNTLLNNVQNLENKINNLTDLDGITKEVQNAIDSATIDVENLINDKADEAISSKLGDYVKTSTLNERLDGYVASTAFDTYRSDSSKSFAQSSRIVANSKFLKLPNGDVDCLVRISGEITGFKSVEDYFKSLSASEKATILGDKTFGSDDEALEDPDVIAKLIGVCENTFKTVVSEMSVISQKVGEGYSESSIIATVNKNGKAIVSSIFAAANEKGSGIALNADNILINGEHNLNVQSGGNISVENGGNFTINSGGKFQIESNNFNIDEHGTVTVKGAIKATSLEITGSDGLMIDIGDETKLANFVKKHQDTASGGSSYDDTWLKEALNGSTTIDGGLVLSNAILTQDSANNITAGMIGSNTSENDVRFFAGTSSTDLSDLESASFRVHEDGTVYMSKAIVDVGGYIESSFVDLDEETIGSVKMSGGSLVYEVAGNMWGGTAVVGYRTNADKGLISIYPNNEDPGLYIQRDGGRGFSVEIESGPVGIKDESCIKLYGNSYIESHGNAVYKGFKTPITRIESSGEYNIDIDYHTILTAGSKIKLKTSNSPANGTEYDIYVWKYDIGLDMNGKGALKFVNGSTATEYGIGTVITLSKDTYYHIVYDGTCWLIHQ